MKTIILDIESDNLLLDATVIHCIALKVNNEEVKAYTSEPIKGSSGSIEEALEICKGNLLVMHNGINFDMPCIKKLTKVDLWEHCQVYDTLLASKLAYPNMLIIDSNNKKLGNLRGSHSLKSWGIRLGNYKGDYNDWSKLTEEMVTYCKQDVEVTYSLYNKLLKKEIPDEAMWLEQEFAKIIQRQEAYGVLFDVEKAKALHVELMKEKEEAHQQLMEVFKPLKTWIPKAYPKIAYKKDGSKSAVLINQERLGCHYNDNMEWGYYEDVEFKPSSGQHIVRWIEDLYGKQKWGLTEKGSPKTGAEHLERMFAKYDWALPLLRYMILGKTLSQLATAKGAWLNYVKEDGRIHGSIDTLGAVSRRCTHRNPNLAQVPSVNPKGTLSEGLKELKASLGVRCRSLFIAPKGKKIVGCDASGLELRTLSHYLARFDGGAYGRAVDSGDPKKGTDVHTLNQKSAGLPTRDDAKTFIYAFLYGAGVDKLGSITGGGAKEGTILRKRFLKKIPALEKLIDGVQKAVSGKGFLKAMDGNKFFIRSSHSALNTLLQGCGALVMKYYLILLDRNLQEKFKAGGQYEFVLNVHDEVQIEVNEDIAKEVSKTAEATFKDVTERLGFRIPLKGEAKIGDSWYDTH